MRAVCMSSEFGLKIYGLQLSLFPFGPGRFSLFPSPPISYPASAGFIGICHIQKPGLQKVSTAERDLSQSHGNAWSAMVQSVRKPCLRGGVRVFPQKYSKLAVGPLCLRSLFFWWRGWGWGMGVRMGEGSNKNTIPGAFLLSCLLHWLFVCEREIDCTASNIYQWAGVLKAFSSGEEGPQIFGSPKGLTSVFKVIFSWKSGPLILLWKYFLSIVALNHKKIRKAHVKHFLFAQTFLEHSQNSCPEYYFGRAPSIFPSTKTVQCVWTE